MVDVVVEPVRGSVLREQPVLAPLSYTIKHDSDHLPRLARDKCIMKHRKTEAFLFGNLQGDIVLFHQYLVHGSQLPNLSGKLRWALDFRYQDAAFPTLRKTQGHLARSEANPGGVVRDGEHWAGLGLT